jgi:hypothetical protein
MAALPYFSQDGKVGLEIGMEKVNSEMFMNFDFSIQDYTSIENICVFQNRLISFGRKR